MSIVRLNITYVDGELWDSTDIQPVADKVDEVVDQVNRNTNEILAARDGAVDLITKINYIDANISNVTNEVVAARKGKPDLKTELDYLENAITASNGIDDTTITTATTWSSNKINSEIINISPFAFFMGGF